MGFVWGLKEEEGKKRKDEAWGLKAEGRNGGECREEGWKRVEGGVTDVQAFERKLNKYLISQRSTAPWRWPLSQAF